MVSDLGDSLHLPIATGQIRQREAAEKAEKERKKAEVGNAEHSAE